MIAALRLCLEAFGIACLVFLVGQFLFPGTWRGLGVADALRAADAGSAAPVAAIAPADMAALLLSVVTITLGILAFLVSLAAFLGYGVIRETAITTAEKAARDKFDSMLPDVAAKAGATATEVARATALAYLAEGQRTFAAEDQQASGMSSVDPEAISQAATGKPGPPSPRSIADWRHRTC